jgi:hypothetical protein
MTYELYFRYRHDDSYPWEWRIYARARDLVEMSDHLSAWEKLYENVPLESVTLLDFGEGEYGIDPGLEMYDGKLVEEPVRLANA